MTNIFQAGWNHQLVNLFFMFYVKPRGDAVNAHLLHNAGFVRLALEEHRDILPMPLWKKNVELEL